MNFLDAEIVELGKGITKDDLLFHDEKYWETSLAKFYAAMKYPEFPEVFGVWRAVSAPTYEALVQDQIDQAIERKGAGDLNELFNSGDTWVYK